MKNSFEKFAAYKIQPTHLNKIKGGDELESVQSCTGGGFHNTGHWSFHWDSDTINDCGTLIKHGTSVWLYGRQVR